jgi:hypothetical protein
MLRESISIWLPIVPLASADGIEQTGRHLSATSILWLCAGEGLSDIGEFCGESEVC